MHPLPSSPPSAGSYVGWLPIYCVAKNALDLPAAVPQELGLQAWATVPGFCGARVWTQDFMHDRQALYKPSYTLS